MDINKKPFIIIGAITIALIVIILILIVVLGNKNEKRNIQFSMNTVQNSIVADSGIDEQDNIENNTNTNKKENSNSISGEITYIETSDGIEIPVPPTFKYIEGDSSTGAVIEDDNGNQFVWVPIEDINSYQREIFDNNGEGIDIEEIQNLNLTEETDYNIEFDESVEKYNGFYVARYEAGKDDSTEKAVSKEGVLPWTQVVWEKARRLSLEMYEDNDYFQTDLINSYAWDSICVWMENTGIDINDSTSYGNYQNSSDGLNRITETGSNNRWKINNIYDMAGNAWEYTTEEYGDHEKYHIGRGGGYWNYGDLYPISARGTSEDASDLNIGFRVVLYLK